MPAQVRRRENVVANLRDSAYDEKDAAMAAKDEARNQRLRVKRGD